MQGVLAIAERVEVGVVAAMRRSLEVTEAVEVHERRSGQVGDWRSLMAGNKMSRPGALKSTVGEV